MEGWNLRNAQSCTHCWQETSRRYKKKICHGLPHSTITLTTYYTIWITIEAMLRTPKLCPIIQELNYQTNILHIVEITGNRLTINIYAQTAALQQLMAFGKSVDVSANIHLSIMSSALWHNCRNSSLNWHPATAEKIKQCHHYSLISWKFNINIWKIIEWWWKTTWFMGRTKN